MSLKLLLALAACLPLALAGCGGGGGGASSIAPARSLAPAMTGGVFPASETPSPVALDGKNEPLAAAARAHNAALAEAAKTVNAVLLASASGGTETAREALERFVGTARELADAARNSGSAADREEAQRALNAAQLWIGAAQGRLTVADAAAAYSVAANSAQRLFNNAAGTAAFEELDLYISRTLAPLLQAFGAAAQNSGSAADREEARKTAANFRAFQAAVSERLAELQAGERGGPGAAPNGGAQPEPEPQTETDDGAQPEPEPQTEPVARTRRAIGWNTYSRTHKWSYWMAEPSGSVLRDPYRPSAYPAFEVSSGATSITTDQLQAHFVTFVTSPLRADPAGWRSWHQYNGLEAFIKTTPIFGTDLNDPNDESFGDFGGWRTRSGSRIWAQSPRGYSSGDHREYLRDTAGRGKYGGFITDTHLSCRDGVYFRATGWSWTNGAYCEGNAQAGMFGDRTDDRPSASGVWRGLMAGDELSSGSALTGIVTLRYSTASDTVDVAIASITGRGGGGGRTKSFNYQGPRKFTWTRLNVGGDGRFSHQGQGSYLGGFFLGPEAEEAAGVFNRRFADACPSCSPGRDGVIVGGWVAKSSDSPAPDSTFSGGYSGPATGGDYGQGGGGGSSRQDCVYSYENPCSVQ